MPRKLTLASCCRRLETVTVCQQVEGCRGISHLWRKMLVSGPCVLFQGAGAACAAQLMGHYPWFAVYNYCGAYYMPPI